MPVQLQVHDGEIRAQDGEPDSPGSSGLIDKPRARIRSQGSGASLIDVIRRLFLKLRSCKHHRPQRALSHDQLQVNSRMALLGHAPTALQSLSGSTQSGSVGYSIRCLCCLRGEA